MTGLFVCVSLSIAAMCIAATVPADPVSINRIADEGFNHSQVAESAAYLADQIGGRMTNSPAMRKAERWTQDKFKAWGLKNVRTEAFDFGRGWWIESSYVRLLTPRPLELRAIPIAWTPATPGPVSAPIIVAPMAADKDFAEWKGRLAGKIVLVTWPAPPKDDGEAPFQRYSEADIAKLDNYQQQPFDPNARKLPPSRWLPIRSRIRIRPRISIS